MSSLPGYRTPAGTGRSLVLWKIDRPRFLLALAAWSLPAPLVIACFVSWRRFDGTFSWDTLFGVAFAGVMLAVVPLLVLIVRGDAPGPGVTKRPAYVLELLAHGVSLRGPAGEPLGDQSAGTLRVIRANVQPSKAMFGGLALEHPAGALLLMRRQPLGSWSGVPVARIVEAPWTVEDPFFDDMLRHAR